MLPRILEPVPSDSAAESVAYQAMDHRPVNAAFVDDLLSGGSVGPRVMDLGCGPAQIPIILCEKWQSIHETTHTPDQRLQVMAVDFSVDMLELARVEIELAGMLDFVFLQQIDLTQPDSLQEDLANTIMSNTVLHHLDHPETAIQLALRALMPGGRIFIRDLVRPDDEVEIERLVRLHAGADSGEEFAPSQLLRQSFWASLTLDEAKEMVSGLGIPAASVQMTSDRHWTLDWTS